VAAGQPKSAVARAFGITRGTVSVTVKRRQEFGTFSSLKRRGRPRKVNEELERQIAEMKGQGMKFDEVKERLGVRISASTFKRIVKAVKDREPAQEGGGEGSGGGLAATPQGGAKKSGKKATTPKGTPKGTTKGTQKPQQKRKSKGPKQPVAPATPATSAGVIGLGGLQAQAQAAELARLQHLQQAAGHVPQAHMGGGLPNAPMAVVANTHVTNTFVVTQPHAGMGS